MNIIRNSNEINRNQYYNIIFTLENFFAINRNILQKVNLPIFFAVILALI